MSAWVIFGVMLGYVLTREIMHGIERRDLYNRIMAKDLDEYTDLKDITGPPAPVENIIKKRMNFRGQRNGGTR